jgi:hypothetical protein
VVRTDWVTRVAAGQEKVTLRTTAEETARSPQGVWYASKIRRSHPDAVGNEKVVGDVAEFFVDFDVIHCEQPRVSAWMEDHVPGLR